MNHSEQQIQKLLQDSSKEMVIEVSNYFISMGEDKAVSELIGLGLAPNMKKIWIFVSLILSNWKGNEKVVNYYLDGLADQNWPGYQINYDTLLTLGKSILPMIDVQMDNAVSQNDDILIENLTGLRCDITRSNI